MTAVQLTINEQTIEAFPGQTVLQAARSHGLIIPTLCDHPDLTPVGSCRLCVVEVDGWRGEVTACTQPVRAGMVVRTQTPALERSRRMVLELLLRHYHDAGYAANDRMETEFEHWVRQYQAQPPAGFGLEARYPIDSDPNPSSGGTSTSASCAHAVCGPAPKSRGASCGGSAGVALRPRSSPVATRPCWRPAVSPAAPA